MLAGLIKNTLNKLWMQKDNLHIDIAEIKMFVSFLLLVELHLEML